MEFKVHKPSKNIKEIRDYLGDPYTITNIDFENVIHRDLGNGYDFEVSGLNKNSKSFSATIFVWDTSKMERVETISNIMSLIELKDCLGATATKYLNTDR